MPRARVEPTGIDVEYESYGRPHDPTVLLLMGLSGSHILWPLGLIDGLVARGYHVVAYDHRDVAYSTILNESPVELGTVREAFAGWPFDPPYRLEDLALDARGLLDHLDIGSAHLVGTSMGGMVAQHLAFDHHEVVRSLTSINSNAGFAPPPAPLSEPVEIPDPRPPIAWEAFGPWFVEGLRALSNPRYFDESETLELARAVWERGVHPEGNLRHLLAILADGDRSARLARVTAPTLVIHGAQDPLIELAGGRATADATPGARLHVVDDMAHDLPAPLVPRLTEEIAAHLADVERVQPTSSQRS